MTTPRPISRALRAFRTNRASAIAVSATVITVLALIQVPVCGMEMEACVLMSRNAPATGPGDAATGAACPLGGRSGEMEAMECCVEEAPGQAPIQPEGTDTQTQKQQLHPPALQAGGCTGECIPCGPDSTPRAENPEDGAIPEVPLYTLFSSYLS